MNSNSNYSDLYTDCGGACGTPNKGVKSQTIRHSGLSNISTVHLKTHSQIYPGKKKKETKENVRQRYFKAPKTVQKGFSFKSNKKTVLFSTCSMYSQSGTKQQNESRTAGLTLRIFTFISCHDFYTFLHFLHRFNHITNLLLSIA